MTLIPTTTLQPQQTDAASVLPFPDAGDPSLHRRSKQKNSSSQAHQQYRRAQIETASPTRLIVLLYEGAIRFASLGRDAMLQGDTETQNINLVKVQRILAELMGSLDRKTGGEVAENLTRLYVYMLEQTVLANLNDQPAPVEEVLVLLRDLRDTWQEIDRVTTQETGSRPPVATAETSPAIALLSGPARKETPTSSGTDSKSPSRLGDRSA